MCLRFVARVLGNARSDGHAMSPPQRCLPLDLPAPRADLANPYDVRYSNLDVGLADPSPLLGAGSSPIDLGAPTAVWMDRESNCQDLGAVTPGASQPTP